VEQVKLLIYEVVRVYAMNSAYVVFGTLVPPKLKFVSLVMM